MGGDTSDTGSFVEYDSDFESPTDSDGYTTDSDNACGDGGGDGKAAAQLPSKEEIQALTVARAALRYGPAAPRLPCF